MANSLFDPINPTELNRDNLPINGRKTNFLDNITPFTFDSPLSGERVDHFPERIRSGTRDQDFFVGEDREQKLALDQSTAELWGKGIWNTAVEAAVGTLEGAAMLPGIDWTLKQVGESETGYGNFLSDAMASVKEGMKSDIYQTTDSREGFAPWDGTWWASNSETLGTTLSLMIPAMGMASAVGKLGKLAKASALRRGLVSAETLANNASLVKNVENASKILGQATISRWTENTMEAQGTFDETYNELINNGVSEEVARSQAGVAASRAWNANWVNLAQDALQFATIGKTINSISARSAKTVAENAKGLGKKTLGLAGTMASESFEEAGQYVIGQEAKKSVIDQNYRFSDIYSRVIDDYSKDPELHTSMFFGALGGGVFQGAGNIIEGRMQKRIQKDIEDHKEKINSQLNDDYVKETGIDTSLVFNKAMAYADMGVIDDLKDSVNKELSKSDEEFINEGKTQEEVQEYKTKLKDVLMDIDFISDVRMKADTGYKDPMAVRLQVASEYSLRNFGRKLNTVKADLGKLTSDSLAADGTVEAITRFNDINTIEALKAFKEQISVPKEDGTYPVRNLEDVQSYIDERIKQVESEISTRLPEGKSIEQYLKKDKNSTFANSDAFKNNIAAQEELKIAMEDFKLELEIAKGNKTDILRERARKAALNNIKDQIRENKVSLSDIRNKISTIKDPDFKTFIDDTIKNQGSSSIPLGKDRNNDIISRYNGKTLLFAKEMDDMAEAGIDNISIDTVESFVAKYNNDPTFKNKVDAFYDAKAKQEGKFYDLTELRRETINDKEEVVTMDSNPVYQAFTSSDKIANSLEVALVKKINDDTVVFFGFNNSQEMPLSEFKKSYSTTYLYDEFTPLYRLDGSVVANDFNTFVNTKGETVTLISDEAHAMINDPSVDLKGKNVRYRVYSDHPQFSPKGSPKGYLVGVEVEVESGRWLTMGRLPVGKDGDGLSVIREHILQKHRESGSDVIELGSKVTVKQNGFIKRKPTARNPYQTIAKKDDVLAVIIPVQQNEIGLVYGKISEELGADMRASTNNTKLARYAGNTVLMVKQSDGSYVPTKLRTKKVSEVAGMYERVEKLLEAFEAKKGTHTTDDLDRLHAALHEMTFLVIERLPDGRYRQVITTQGNDVWSDPMTFAELKDDIKTHKAMRVDKDRINDKEYHKEYLDKYEILTTDIVPDNRHVGASIAIDLHSDVQVTPEKKADNKKKATRSVEQKSIDIPAVEDYEYIDAEGLSSAFDELDSLNSALDTPTVPFSLTEEVVEPQSIEAKKADIEKRRQEELETTKNIGEDKLKNGRENTKKLVEYLKQRYSATSVQGIIIRILEKLIDFSKYSTIIDSDYLNGRNASGQATWFGMIISQETFDGILAGKEFEVHTFIHEFIHGFTTSKISDYSIEKQGLIPGFKSKLTAKEKNAIEQLQRIFEKVKKDNPKSKEYGFTNLDEFIAEAFSNTSFQYTLKNTKAEGKKSNLFSEFIEAVGDLLFEQLERWAKRFNKEIPERSTITGILEDVLAWTEDLIDQNNKLAYIATNEEINAKYDAELAALPKNNAKKADIERRRQEALDKANKQIEKTNKKEDRRVKVETYRTLDIGGNPVEVEITTNADGSRLLRARQVNEDGSIEPMAYVTERINNKSQATLTNEKLVEGYIGNEDNTLERTNVDENPNQTHIDKINAKYDAELAALEQPVKEELSKDTTVDDSKFDDLDDVEFYRTKERVEDTSPILESEKEWFKKYYPSYDPKVLDDLSTVSNKGGSELYGMFKNGVVYLSSDAATGTLRHEAFHLVFNSMLNDKERKDILAQQRYEKKLSKSKTDIDVEESLADDFMDVKLTGGEIINTFTGKIKEFFKRLWNIVQIILERNNLKGSPSIDQLFYRANRGLYNRFPKFQRNVTRFRKNIYGDLSMSEANMASQVIANNIVNAVVDRLRELYNMPDAETLDVLKKASKLNDPNYKRKENEKDLKGYSFNDLLYLSYRNFNKTSQDPSITEAQKNSLIRVMNALGHVDKDGKFIARELKNLVVGQMQNHGIKADVSNLNETVAVDINSDEEGVPDDQADESFDFKDRFTSSLKDFRARTRQLFASIPNSSKKFATYTLYHDPATVYNTIKKHLESSLDQNDMMTRLESLYDLHPDYEIISDKFIKDPTLAVEFYKNFAQRNNTSFIKVITDKDGTKTVLESNKTNITSDIRADWHENFLNTSNYLDNDTGKISDKGIQTATDNLAIIKKVVADNVNTRYLSEKDATTVTNLLYDAGIIMDANVIKKVLMTDPPKENQFEFGRYKMSKLLVGNNKARGLEYFYDSVSKGINPFQVSDDDAVKGSSIDMNKMMDNITYNISTMFPEMRSSIFQNGKGKSVDSNLLPRDSARRLLRIKDDVKNNDAETLLAMKSDPFWKDSKFISEIRKYADEMKLAIMDTSESGKGDHREYSELTAKNFHTSLMNMFFNFNKKGEENSYGWYGMPIPSDSTAYNIIRFAKYRTFEAEDLIVDAVNNERNRIKELEVLIAANEAEYNAWVKLDESERKYTRPEAFKDIPFNFLLNGRKYQTFSELNDGDRAIVFNDDIEFATAVNKAYKNYVQRVLQDLVNKNVIEKLDNGDYIIKDEDLDHRIGGTKVTKGDNTEIVNNPVKLLNNLNRFIANATLMNIQTAFLFAGDIAYYKHDKKINGTSIEDFFKRVKQINSPGTYLDTTAIFRPIEGEEIKVRKSYRVGVVQDRDDVVSPYLNNILSIQEKYVRSLNYSENEVKKHLDDIKYKYSGMNITDAFTVIDLYRYREIAVASAQWNNVKEALYQKIMNGDEVDPKEMEIMQPFKPFRYSIQNVAGKYVPIQHKNAEMLITPQMAKYNSVHRTAMEKMGYTFKENGTFTFDKEGRDANKYIDALMYNSSVKVGEMRTFATEEAVVPSETQLFANDDYRIQMGTPDHFIDSEINIGSQIRKLIIEGFDLKDPKTYVIGGKEMTGKQIVDMYNDIISKNLEESYQEVRDIFTDDNGNIDRNKMVSELKKYIIERELGTDYLEAVELINGSPTIPYWYPTIAYNLQAIFSAFYKNNITKQTASGMALFNSSSVGYMEGTALPKPKIVFKADGSSIEHIEALIPINNKRLLKYVDPKTGLVDVSLVEKQDPKLLKGLFYRIPSEDKYSMVHIKVVGYLPTSMGAQIILPDEITTMAGLDFDIDKMFGMMYETDNKGLTVASGMDSKAARNNMMLDLMYGIMQLPETAERQLSPGNFDNLKKIKNDVLNITGTDASLYFYSQASKVEVQQRNMMGKELIGTFANHRVNHIFFTLADFKLVEPIEFDGRSLSSLSETISPIDKKNIGQRLATFVAAVVDNAKDPIASMLNLTPFLSDVAALMIRVGHTDALVGRFLSQKVFVKLSQDYSNSSDFGAVAVIKLLTDMRNNLVVSDRQVEEAKTLSITMDVLKENLKNPDPVVDLALINKMLLMYEQADMLRKIMSTMRYDSTSKAAGPTYFETEAKIQESGKIINNEDHIIGYKKFLSNDSLKWVRDFFTYGVVNANRDMLSILELPYRNEMFENLIGEKGYFNRWKLKGSLKPNELEIITRAIMTVNASSFRPFNNERSLDLMKTFPDRLQTFKNKYHQYDILTRLITVEQVKASSTRYSIPFKTLKFNKMGITPSHMQILRNKWTEMLESEDQTVRTFAQDLAAYSFFTSGFMFKKNSIAEAIPVTWMTQITHEGKTFIQHITEKNDSSDLNEIQKEEIVRNLYQSLDVFGTVKEKDNGVEISMDKATGLYRGSVDMNVNRFYVDTYVNKEKVRTYSPYVRFQLSGDIRLLKLVSVNMDSNVATYEEIQPLGIHNRYVQFSDGSKTIKGVINVGVSKVEKKKEPTSVEKVKEFWTRDKITKQTDKVFLFGDNTNDRIVTKYIPSSTQAVIRGLPNAIGIDTKKDRGTNDSSYFTDGDFDVFKQQVDAAIKQAKDSGKTIVIPADGIGTGKAMLETKAPKLFDYLQQELDKLKVIEDTTLSTIQEAEEMFGYTETVIPEKITEDILPMIKEDISLPVVELVAETKQNTFTHKGLTIDIDINLSEDQRRALEGLIDFVENRSDDIPYKTLIGPAGTGKTTIIAYLEKYMKKKNYTFNYMAPTHAATVELAFSIVKTGNKHLPSTIRSSITYNSFLETYDFTKKMKDRFSFGNNVIIVDEASMMDDQDSKDLLQAASLKQVKIIFMGDSMQIPKPDARNPEKKSIPSIFNKNRSYYLSTIHRQKSGDMKDLLSKMRSVKEFKLFKPSVNNERLFFTNNENAFYQRLNDSISENPENTIYISYTNSNVKKMNSQIRALHGRTGETKVGDIVIGYLGYGQYQIEKGNIANSVSYTIDSITKKGTTYIIKGLSDKLQNLIDNGITTISNNAAFASYYPLSKSDSLLFDESTQEEMMKNNETLSDIFDTIHRAELSYKSKAISYSQYQTILERTSQQLSSIYVGNDYVYNPASKKMELHDKQSPQHSKLKTTGQGSLLINKSIDYGHAITIHKSQGSTHQNVFFDSSTIKKMQNTKILTPEGEQLTVEAQTLAYVGMSRASNSLNVYEADNEFETITVENNQVIDKQEKDKYESLQYAIATFLSDQKTNEPMTTSEAMDSFEAYSNSPINVSKESWNKMTKEEQLANWFAEQKCR